MSSGPTISFQSVRASLLRKERETERAEPPSQKSSEPFPNFSRNEKFRNLLRYFSASTRHRNFGTRPRARAVHALPSRSHASTWNSKKSKIHQHQTPPPWRTMMPFSAPGSKTPEPLVAVRIKPFQSEWFDPTNPAAYVPRIFRGRKTRGVIRLPALPRSKSFNFFFEIIDLAIAGPATAPRLPNSATLLPP